MSDLPLKIRVGIRDQWESPRAPIATCIDSLAKTLGYTISPQISWPTLYANLKDNFVDQAMFVSAVCRIGMTFYTRMLSRIEDKRRMAEWTDSLLEGMAKREVWVLRIESHEDASAQRPQLSWDENDGYFMIEIPKGKPPGNSIIEAGFDEDLDALFASPYILSEPNLPLPPIPTLAIPSEALASSSLSVMSPSPTSTTKPLPLPAIVESVDDWTEVNDSGEAGAATPPTPPSKALDVEPSSGNNGKYASPKLLPLASSPPLPLPPLPPVATPAVITPNPPTQPSPSPPPATPPSARPQSYSLDRPTKLFAGPTLNPVMTIDASGSRLVIHCSHEATLQQLGKYLDRWARIDYHDSLKRPMLTMKMVESAFFDDVIDTIVIEPTYARGSTEPLNPTFILSFVEGVLGYKEEYTNGSRWIFKLYPIRI